MKRPGTLGVMLLAVWLIIHGLGAFGLILTGPLGLLQGILALAAGILILIGR